MTDSHWFCDNEKCRLHVPLDDGKEWAVIDGITIDRLPVNGRMRCLLCRVQDRDAQVGVPDKHDS